MRFSLPETKYSQPIQGVGFFENLLEQVRAIPGIRAAGVVRAVPGRGELLRLTLIDGLKPAVAGLVLGLAGAAAATRLLSSLLYGVQALDTTVFAAVALILLTVASIACLLPAWRASRVDPITALRYE